MTFSETKIPVFATLNILSENVKRTMDLNQRNLSEISGRPLENSEFAKIYYTYVNAVAQYRIAFLYFNWSKPSKFIGAIKRGVMSDAQADEIAKIITYNQSK